MLVYRSRKCRRPLATTFALKESVRERARARERERERERERVREGGREGERADFFKIKINGKERA